MAALGLVFMACSPTAEFPPTPRQELAAVQLAQGATLDPPVWEQGAPMNQYRKAHTATLLQDGKVLVAGGQGTLTPRAEVYDPATRGWLQTGALSEELSEHTATLLLDGRVLVAGGATSSGASARTELYDPATGLWSQAGSLLQARYRHAAALLPDGKVLIVGGEVPNASDAHCEVYDPVTQTSSEVGPLNQGRHYPTATRLLNGKVLIVGGLRTSSEVYDPASRAFYLTRPNLDLRYLQTATLLPNGKVLVAGGDVDGNSLGNELYDPDTNTWSEAGLLTVPRYQAAAALLPNGTVIITGGGASTSEVYDPATHSWIPGARLFYERSQHTATSLNSGQVLVSGGDIGHRIVELFIPRPLQTFFESGPAIPSNQALATFTFRANEPGASFACSLDGAAFSPCASPWTTPSLTEGLHTVRVQARDAAGNMETPPASTFWVTDLTPPETRLLTGPPPASTRVTTATWTFDSNDAGAGFECSLDGAAFSPCTSPVSHLALEDGPHTFQLRARDAAGNVDATPETRSWTVDTTRPTTGFGSTPPSRSNQVTATFAFSANESGPGFVCSLDEAAFNPCTSPWTTPSLTEGAHTLRIQARDAAGNVETPPASYSWVIDLTPPETQLLTGTPPESTRVTTATWTFGSNDAGAGFECSLDGAAFSPCTSPVSHLALAEGLRTFQVRARDAAGNVDATPETRSWIVDTTRPELRFVSTPGPATRQRIPSFSFSSEESPVTFECSLDGAPFAECPEVFASQDDGDHQLVVRARDAAGNPSLPVQHSWTVDTVPPETPALLEPASGQELFTAKPLFSGTAESGTTVTLLVDGVEAGSVQADARGVWKGGGGSALSWGEHRVSVMATDKAGNSSPLLPEVPFSISQRGNYRLGCSASPTSWQGSRPWALLLLGLLRRRDMTRRGSLSRT